MLLACLRLQLLKKQHLADVLEVAEMRDGIVSFEDDKDADKFASMLEEEGHTQVRGNERNGSEVQPCRLRSGLQPWVQSGAAQQRPLLAAQSTADLQMIRASAADAMSADGG